MSGTFLGIEPSLFRFRSFALTIMPLTQLTNDIKMKVLKLDFFKSILKAAIQIRNKEIFFKEKQICFFLLQKMKRRFAALPPKKFYGNGSAPQRTAFSIKISTPARIIFPREELYKLNVAYIIPNYSFHLPAVFILYLEGGK